MTTAHLYTFYVLCTQLQGCDFIKYPFRYSHCCDKCGLYESVWEIAKLKKKKRCPVKKDH